jgi:aryl-alcohol dehydrogenase-like predicted oxidoreductase
MDPRCRAASSWADRRSGSRRSVSAPISILAAQPGAEIAAYWLVACEPSLVPVVGVQHVEQLDDNLGFVNVQLSADTMAAVAAAAAGLEPMSLLDAIPRSAQASRWSQRSSG